MLKQKFLSFTSIFAHILLSCLSHLVPKKKGYWAFVSLQFNGKYSGNNKASFEYFQENKQQFDQNTQAVYITNNKKTEKHIQDLGYPVTYNRYLWLLPMLRAELIFVDGARAFLGFGRFNFIQLWHGTGFKNIGLAFTGKKYTSIRHYFLKRFFDKSLLISATSKDDQQRKQVSFNSLNVKITGSPRNDIFFKPIAKDNARKKILYAPTFRDTGGQFSAMDDDNWGRLQLLMERIDADFLVKRHPADFKLIVPNDKKNILDVTGQTEDIQNLLATVDVLITDYSGISSDYVITKRPIIFYTYDYDEYIKANRTFFYDIKEVLPGPFINNPSDLINHLENMDWFNNENYQIKYNLFREKFHTYCDGNSSERLLQEVLKLKFNRFR